MKGFAFGSSKLAFMPSKSGGKAKRANMKELEVYVDGRMHRLPDCVPTMRSGREAAYVGGAPRTQFDASGRLNGVGAS